MRKIVFLFVIVFFCSNLYSQVIDEKGFSKHYVGTINKNLKVRMNLSTYNLTTDQKRMVKGDYFYENIGQIITLSGEVDKNGNLTLTESMNDQETGKITGKIVSSKINGFWSSADSKKKLELSLTEDYTNSLEFKSYFIQQSYYYQNDKEYDPYEIEYFYTNPIKYSNNSIIPKIQKSLSKLFFDVESGNIADTLKSFISKNISVYDSEIKIYQADMDEIDKSYPFYGWNSYRSIRPFFNDYNILSLEDTAYEFQGGAHGDSHINYYVYNLNNGEKISLYNIFKETSTERLTDIILKKLDVYCRDVKNEPMDDLITEKDSVKPNENFYITNGGIGFFYNTYEIAAYVAGSFEIFIPYSEIKDLIRSDSIVSQFLKK